MKCITPFSYSQLFSSKIVVLIFFIMGICIGNTSKAQNSAIEKTNQSHQCNSIKTENSTNGRFIGTMNNIVIFIRFSDQEEFTESFDEIDKLFNDPDGLSVRHFYAENSNNKFIINNHFYPRPNGDAIVSYQDKHPKAYYDPYDQETNPIGYQGMEVYYREFSLEKDAILSVKQELENSGLNFDLNDDDLIDNFTFIIKYDGDGPFSIIHYPHGGNRCAGDEIYIGGKKVWGLNVHTTQYLGEEKLGFICHEMFHGFAGAADLYNASTEAFMPVGVWDPMGTLSVQQQPHFLVYTKMKYGTWLESIPQITKPGTYTLESISKNPFAAYEIPSPNSEYESFIVEYRKPEGMFESGLQSDQIETGLIIYRVDSRYNGGAGGEPFFEVYTFRPLYGTHPEEGNDSKAGFAIENGRTIFNNKTNPSCFLNDGSDGGIFIANVTSNKGETISFDVIDPYNLVSPTALFTAENVSGIFPLPVNFKECSDGFPTSFNWDFGDGKSSTERHPNHIYDTPGTYTVSLKVSNSEGTNKIVKTDIINVSKKEQTITFDEIPEAKVKDVITLNASASSGLEVSYSVISGDATIDPNNNTITFNAEGEVKILAQQGGNEEYSAAPEQTILVTVSKKDQTITFTELHDAMVNDIITLNASASSGLEVSYSVISGDATIDSDEKTIIFNTEGQVQIMALQEGNEEYYAAPQKTVTVTVSVYTGIKEISDKNISIYPIPMKSILNIKADKCYKLQLIDITGKIKLQHNMDSKTATLNTDLLHSGIYILRLIDKDQNIFNRRIIKK